MPPVDKLLTPLRGIRVPSENGARHYVKPHPIPNIPLMNELEQLAINFLVNSSIRPEETAIVGAQHLLETTSTLFQKLRNLGFEAYITGKCYSTSPAVFEALKGLGVHLWPGTKPERLGEYQAASEKDVMTVLEEVEKNPKIKNIIILDDGGRFFEKIPPHFRRKYRIIGAEQTRKAYYSRNVEIAKIQIINVAQSAAKLLLESPFIADAVVEQIFNITTQLDKEKCVVGIIGFGSIGKALATKFIKEGFKVAIYDKDPESYKNYPYLNQVEIMSTIEQLFMHTNFIIGCTGQDNTEDFDPLKLNGHNRIVASASSEDEEFNTLLRTIASKSVLRVNPLSTIECETKSGNILEILYGGFPVNFALSAVESFNVPAEKIALTQGLLFSAIIQAVEMMEKNNRIGTDKTPNNVMLDPVLQQKVVEIWHRTTKAEDLPLDLIYKFLTDVSWIRENSKGSHFHSAVFRTNCTPPGHKMIAAKL